VSDKKTMRLEAVSGFFVHGHGPLGRTKAVALSPDERRAVSVGEDGTLALHDLVTRAVRVVGRAAVQDAVFVTNERVLLGLVDGDVELWDLDGSASIASFTGLIAPSLPVSVAVSADRKLGASAGAEGVRVFDAGTLAEPRSLAPLRLAARCVAFYPDGKRILASYQDGRARVLDVKTGRELPDPDFEGQGRQELPCVAISQDGPVLVAALNRDDNRATIRVVKGSGRTARGLTLEDYWKSSVHGVAFARGGRAVVAVGDGDETLHVWDVATGEERTIATPGGKNAAVAVFKDGRRVLCGDERGLLPIVDLDARAQDAWHTNVVRSMAFTRDGKRLVSSSKDGTILVWDAAGKLVSTLNGLDRKDRIPVAVNAIALLPGDAEVLAAMYRQEGALRRFSLEAGLQEMSGFLNLDAQNILSVTLSPDGALAATGDAGGNIRLFRVNDGSTEAAPFAIIPGERVYLASIAFSPTGSRLLACGQEGRLAVWEVATRRQLIGPREVEHRDEDELPAVFIDDRHVLAGTTTGALRIIDLKMWTEEAVPAPEPHSPVRAIALLAGTTPDAIFAHGERALVSTHDGFVRLVDLVHKVELDRLSLASVATDAESFAVAPGERSFAVGTYHGAVLRFALDGPR
jgi:WD40 repeat protein